MNFNSIDNKSLTNHPYIISGIVSTLIWMMFSFFLNKKSSKQAFISGLIFAIWYSLGWFAWNYSSNSFKESSINYSVNRYTLGITATVIWFLYKLFIQRKRLNTALISTGIFLIFYILAEIVFTILNTI